MGERDTTMLHNVGFKLKKKKDGKFVLQNTLRIPASGCNAFGISGWRGFMYKEGLFLAAWDLTCVTGIEPWNIMQTQSLRSHTFKERKKCGTAWECAVRSPISVSLSHVAEKHAELCVRQIYKQGNITRLWCHLNTKYLFTYKELLLNQRGQNTERSLMYFQISRYGWIMHINELKPDIPLNNHVEINQQ